MTGQQTNEWLYQQLPIKRFQDNSTPHRELLPGQLPLDNSHLVKSPPDNSHLGQLPLGQLPREQFPPRTIVPGTIPLDNSHLGLLYCPQIITPQNYCLKQWQFQITISSWLFSASFAWSNYIISVMTKKIIMIVLIKHGV